jgi:hypothetical protein
MILPWKETYVDAHMPPRVLPCQSFQCLARSSDSGSGDDGIWILFSFEEQKQGMLLPLLALSDPSSTKVDAPV